MERELQMTRQAAVWSYHGRKSDHLRLFQRRFRFYFVILFIEILLTETLYQLSKLLMAEALDNQMVREVNWKRITVFKLERDNFWCLFATFRGLFLPRGHAQSFTLPGFVSKLKFYLCFWREAGLLSDVYFFLELFFRVNWGTRTSCKDNSAK